MVMGRPIDKLVGQTFGRLTVIKLSNKRASNGAVFWICRCSCLEQTTIEVIGQSLKRGDTKSCGCLHIKHGASKSVKIEGNHRLDYVIWSSIKTRCYNKNDPGYKKYGAKGIKVFKGWKKDFPRFSAYIRSLPNCPKSLDTRKFGHRVERSIDRIDGSKHYEPGNIKWSTLTEQANNKSNNLMVNYEGEELTLAEAVEKYAVVSYTTVYLRIHRYGWDLKEALLTQSRQKPK